jgi:glycosyltransferase involved in cell wall biosynthesis
MDEIILVDTGSTDKTKEIAEARGCRVFDFKWEDSFAKARNFAFMQATKDYILWLDLDDELVGKEAFLNWKKNVMGFADCHFATYNYTLDANKKPVIRFLRERVFRRAINPMWQYDIHEGIILNPEWSRDYAASWQVNHLRSAEDIKADKSRNLNIIKKIVDEGRADGRMLFYYAKELFEAGQPNESLVQMDAALKNPKLEMHDRLLAYQYASYAAQSVGDQIKDDLAEQKNRWYKKAVDYAVDGLKLDANRAEYCVSAADSFIKQRDIRSALPFYAAAKACQISSAEGSPYCGPIFNFTNCYGELPGLQLAKIYFNMGNLEAAEKEARECSEKHSNQEAKELLDKILLIKPLITIDNNQTETEDIVFTVAPGQAYPFDEVLYETAPLGGSETALVQMAREMKKLTGRPVKVFNARSDVLTAPSGVEYIPNTQTNLYFSKNKPKVHIAWRHNIEVTRAKTYLWCHDLQTPGVESKHNFYKHICLSSFHKDFVMGKQGVPSEKIWVSRNGIPVEKFNFQKKPKNPNKIVWLSSPDRGLENAIEIMDLIRKEMPEAELHIYYGIENLYKYGPAMSALADKLKGMMATRPWCVYHGFTEQSKMYQDVSDAVLWLHPCNFIETFAITALEALANGIYPVTRRLGALANTLADAETKGQVTLLDHGGFSLEEKQQYADAVISAIKEKKYERVSLDMEKHTWESVAKEWVQEMGL